MTDYAAASAAATTADTDRPYDRDDEFDGRCGITGSGTI